MFLAQACCIFAYILLHKVTFKESILDSRLILPKSNGVLLKFIDRAGNAGELCPEMTLASKRLDLGNEPLTPTLPPLVDLLQITLVKNLIREGCRVGTAAQHRELLCSEHCDPIPAPPPHT